MKKSILNSPFPSNTDLKSVTKTILGIAAFVFVFVLLFRSEHLVAKGTWLERTMVSLYYGLITFVVPFISMLILLSLISEKFVWKVKHEILLLFWHLLSISTGNFWLSIIVFKQDISLLNFIQSVGITTIIGVIPIVLYVLLKQQKLLKKHLQEAKEINESTSLTTRKNDSIHHTIKGVNMNLSKFIFAESDKNYIIFHFTSEEEKIRLTMKELEKEMTNWSNIRRCHRAYFVNIDAVQSVTGNAQGLKLLLATNDEVPVS